MGHHSPHTIDLNNDSKEENQSDPQLHQEDLVGMNDVGDDNDNDDEHDKVVENTQDYLSLPSDSKLSEDSEQILKQTIEQPTTEVGMHEDVREEIQFDHHETVDNPSRSRSRSPSKSRHRSHSHSHRHKSSSHRHRDSHRSSRHEHRHRHKSDRHKHHRKDKERTHKEREEHEEDYIEQKKKDQNEQIDQNDLDIEQTLLQDDIESNGTAKSEPINKHSNSRNDRHRDDKDKGRDKERERERDRERDRDRHRHRSRRSRSRSSSRSKSKSSRHGHKSSSRRHSESPISKRNARTIFVMQLAARVTSRDLDEFFSSIGKVREVRLIMDTKTRRHKGIAYIEFQDASSIPLAFALNGQKLCGVPLIIQPTQAEKNRQDSIDQVQQATNLSASSSKPPGMRIYVGSLHPDLTEDMLRAVFEPFGMLSKIEIIRTLEGKSKGYGFVTFYDPDDANKAIKQLNGFELAGKPIRVSKTTERSDKSQYYANGQDKSNSTSSVHSTKYTNPIMNDFSSPTTDRI